MLYAIPIKIGDEFSTKNKEDLSKLITAVIEGEENDMTFSIIINSTEMDKKGFQFANGEVWVTPKPGGEEYRMVTWLNRNTNQDITVIESVSSEAMKEPESPPIEQPRFVFLFK